MRFAAWYPYSGELGWHLAAYNIFMNRFIERLAVARATHTVNRARRAGPAVICLLLCTSPVCAISLPQIEHRSGRARSETIRLKNLDERHQYSLLYSLSPLRGFG